MHSSSDLQESTGLVTLWKSLETSGFGMVLNFLFWKSLKNAFALKLKILILRKSCFLNFQDAVLLAVLIYT